MSVVGVPGDDGGSLRPLGIWIVALMFAGLAMASVAALLAWDAFPGVFPPRSHLLLGASPLVLVAIAFLVYQGVKRPRPLEIVKAVVLAAAFLFWAANQLLPDFSRTVLLNDVAIALFALDVFLGIVGWPPVLRRAVLAQAGPEFLPRAVSQNGAGDGRSGVERGGSVPGNPPH
jgi:hypothetical protein